MCVFFLAIDWGPPDRFSSPTEKIIAKTIIRICPFRQILSCSNLPTSSVELIWPITELYFRQILSTDFMNRFCQDVKTGPNLLGQQYNVGEIVVSYIHQRIGCQPEKNYCTSEGGQSRSWSAEQGKKENKRKSLAAYRPPPLTLLVRRQNKIKSRDASTGATQVSIGLAYVQGYLRLVD